MHFSAILRPNKNISVVRVTCQKKLSRVGREIFFFKIFFYIENCIPIFRGHNFFTCNTFICCFKLNREQLFLNHDPCRHFVLLLLKKICF